MNKVQFNYNNQDYFIQCNDNDKMGNIFSKILNKIEKSNNDIIFLYNGIKVNEELTFDECINEEDRDNNKMNLKIIKKEPEIENDIIVNNNINNSNNINEYYSVKDKYENIDIKKIKVFLQYQTLNEINNMFILRDGRILTNQTVHYGDGEEKDDDDCSHGGENKLCIYSIKNNKFKCDINIDSVQLSDCIEMSDGNVIMVFIDQIKIVKIHQKFIEEILTINKENAFIKEFFYKENFYIKYLADEQPPQAKGFFKHMFLVYDHYLCKYENGKLTNYKKLNDLFKKEKIKKISQITSNEYALLSIKKGNDDYIIFYDMCSDKKIKKLKIGNGEGYEELFLLNKDNLIVFRGKSIILIDTYKRNIKRILTCDIDIVTYEFTPLNEKAFLISGHEYIYLLNLIEPNYIVLKGKAKLIGSYEKPLRYPGNKLICYNRDNNNIILIS